MKFRGFVRRALLGLRVWLIKQLGSGLPLRQENAAIRSLSGGGAVVIDAYLGVDLSGGVEFRPVRENDTAMLELNAPVGTMGRSVQRIRFLRTDTNQYFFVGG